MSKFHYMLVVSITGIVICGLAQGTAFATVIGYWQFNEKVPGSAAPVGDTIVDSSANGHNGAVTASALGYVAGAPGYDGAALAFGNAGYVEIPASAQFAFANDFTLEAEIRTTATEPVSAIAFNNPLTAVRPSWWFRMRSGGNLQSNVADSAAEQDLFGAEVVNDGDWHHVALVYDRTAATMSIYVDYTLDNSVGTGSIVGTVGTDTNVIWIGTQAPAVWPFTGDMDFVRLSDQALTPSQFVQPIPEPTTMVLFATSLLGVLAYAWRKRK